MSKTSAFQNLLNGSASEEEIRLLKQLLASGEISIGGNVKQSVIILGSGNTVELPPAALDRLGARPLLGNLARDLNGDEIALGLQRLEAELPLRAPVFASQFQEQARRLRPTLKTNPNALSESARKERLEALAHVNSLCMEALDISFNAVATGETLPEYEAQCPFRGLESFRVEDREFFFGREELTQKLVGKIQAHSFLAVLGASGSGKSSLVMAGMIPALNLDYAIIRPGTNPLDALDSARGKSLLVVDQFEELFTLTRDEKTHADFISALLDFAKSSRVIITLRSDFLGEAGAYRSLNAEIQNHLEIIPPMNADELRRAMEGQARWARLEFEADLSQQILDDVAGEPGAMPLLQHALWELWNRRYGRHLPANEYRAFGGVKQAITSTAEKVYADCSKPEQEQVRDIFLRLTRLDEGDEGRDTRRRVPLEDLIPSGADAASISALLDKLANARLIVKTVNDEVTEIEVAHEALIRHWERLRIWLNEDRDDLRLRESVSESAMAWDRSGRDESMLNHRGGRLDDALKLKNSLTSQEQTYLRFCVSLRDRSEQQRKRIIKMLSAGLVMMLLIAFLAGLQWRRAEQQKRISRAGELAAIATSKRNESISLAYLLGVESINTYDYYQSRKVLLDNFYFTKSLREFYWEQETEVTNLPIDPSIRKREQIAEVTSVDIDPSGKTIAYATLGEFNISTVTLRNIIDHKTIGQPIEMHSQVNSLQFNSTGNLLMIGGFKVIVWDLDINQEICGTGNFGYGNNTDAVFSPDGHAIAFSKDNGDVYVLSLDSDYCRYVGLKPFFSHSYGIYSIAFDPTGHFLAVGGDDKKIILLDVLTGKMIGQPLTGHKDRVTDIEFSPDGKILASGSEDKTIILWDMNTHTPINQSSDEHTGWITDIEFNAKGNLLASSSTDNTIVIWDVNKLIPLYPHIVGHDKTVSSLDFGPEHNMLISGGLDGALIRWDVSGNTVLDVLPPIKIEDMSQMALSPDGKIIGIGKLDGTVLFVDSLTSDVLGETLFAHSFGVTGIKFSNDGKLMATSSCHQFEEESCTQREVIFWDTKNRRPLNESLLNELETFSSTSGLKSSTTITSLEFNPDDKFLLTASCELLHNSDVSLPSYVSLPCNSNIINIWDVAAKKEIWDSSGIGGNIIVFHPNNNIFAVGGCQMDQFGTCQKGTMWIKLLMPGLPWLVGSDWGWSTAHDGLIYSLAFNKDGTRLASGSKDGSIIIWDTSKLNSIGKLPPRLQYDIMVKQGESQPVQPLGQMLDRHSDAVTSLSFSQDGSFLASGSLDRKIFLWDADSRQLLGELSNDQQNKIITIDFTSDGKNLVYGSTDGKIKFVNINVSDWIRISCNIVGRNFTRLEWAKFFPDEEYRATCPQWPLDAETTPTATP